MTKHPHDFGLEVNFDTIPRDIRAGKWCVWEAKPRKNGKVDKIPSNGKKFIKTTEPDTWLTFDQARKIYEQGGFNGVGRLTEKDGFVFVDIDKSMDIPEELKALGTTYCERSPSNTGMRLIYKADHLPNRDIAEPYEVYAGNSPRFLTITGVARGNFPIAHKNGQLATLVAAHSGEDPTEVEYKDEADPFVGVIKSDASSSEVREILTYVSADTEDTWIKVGMALHHQYNGNEEGFKIWDEWSQTSDKYDGARPLDREWKRFDTDNDRKLGIPSIAEMAKRAGADVAAIGRKYTGIDGLIAEELQQEVDSNGRFELADELLEGEPEKPNWIIKHILERDSIAMVYGASGSGKSYFAINLAIAVSTGGLFAGKHPTKQGAVVYMCGEGYRGVKARLRAVRINDNLSSVGKLYLTNRITDMSSIDDLRATVEELKALGIDISLIIIDTLARASGAYDENSTADMNKFVRACDYIRNKFDGATVMPIHHTGKGDKQAARGSSVLRAAMDVEVMVEPAEGGLIVSSTKAKDGEPFKPMGFEFKRVNFDSYDEDGEQLYSHVIVPNDSLCEEKDTQKHTETTKQLMRIFDTLFEREDLRVPAPADFALNWGLNAPAEGLPKETVRRYFMDEKGDNDSGRRAFNRGLNTALDREFFAVLDDVICKL